MSADDKGIGSDGAGSHLRPAGFITADTHNKPAHPSSATTK
jgi:hypothetical protein